MSQNSMADISSPSTLLDFSHDHEKLDLESIRVLVASINQRIHELLEDTKTRKSLKEKCTSKLEIQKQEFFEFSDQSILSNLYWGIESVEAAIQAKSAEEKTSRLVNSERMLQVPALLDEHGVTAGIPNHYLVCCSYFYLSIVRKLQRDDQQVAMHFLQALLVSPRVVYKEFAPELCKSLFLSCIVPESHEPGAKGSSKSKSTPLKNFNKNEVNEAMKEMARNYKAWLMYYQVMSYGETTQRHQGHKDIPFTNDEAQVLNMKSSCTEAAHLYKRGNSMRNYHHFEKVHPLNPQEYITGNVAAESIASKDISKFQNHTRVLKDSDQTCGGDITKRKNIKCIRDLLKESQSDTPISLHSCNSSSTEETFSVEFADSESSMKTKRLNVADQRPETFVQNYQAPCSTSSSDSAIFMPRYPGHLMQKEVNDDVTTSSERFSSSFSELEMSISEVWDINSRPLLSGSIEKRTSPERLQLHDIQHLNCIGPTSPPNIQFSQIDHQGSYARIKKHSSFTTNKDAVRLHSEATSQIEQVGILEKIVSKLCFSERLAKCDEDYTVEITTLYEMLNSKTGLKYSLLKDIILDQLLTAISTSKEEKVLRASVSVLSTIISGNKSVIENIKKKGMQLGDLANALKRNVYEAATLIYLINPSPAEIKNLELLPTLLEVVCTSNSYKGQLTSLLLTPPAASLMIIEVLATAFDRETNNRHLAEISSPRVLSGLLDVPRNTSLEEFISLAAILVRCMRFDAECRKYVSQFSPLAPFVSLLSSNHKRATSNALEFFHEILHIPRSSAISLLQQIQKEGSINIMSVLLLLIQQSQPEHKLLAANLLLQLDMLEDSRGKSIYREEAVEALLESLTCEENSATQQLSAFILSNIGGTYSWTGEPYTVAWLVKKAGLTSIHHRNIIRNFDWLDQSLQDAGTDTWCSKIARHIMKFGNPLFRALEIGLKSQSKRVSRDCLTAIAWLGCEIVKSSDDLRYSACEILLSTIEQYVHPGVELEERLLACLCIYNYTCGRGMKKLIHFSEGVRESLRRLSNITWMAEELLKVADYFQPNKWRISCVHTQILEARHKYSGAVSALIYYKGQLCSGHIDGSIKVWNMKGQTAAPVRDLKEHKKAVTCFSLFEQGNCLLSGSSDNTIRVWKMDHRNLECVEVIATKESIQSVDTYGNLIFAVTKSHKMKVFDESRKAKDLFKNKHVKCIRVAQGKVYVGCKDSSIQELSIAKNRQQEIKAPLKIWRMQSRPINSIFVYKDYLYSASATVEGSNIKDWRRNSKPLMSIVPEKGSKVLAMEVVEDFIYLHCSSSMSTLQIWLRGTQHKVARLSADSKITSILTANDMVLCGTEMGTIKGWIPL
ncbi:unnamed protein product [Ilex paraguariensis]|uniref:E3 ubiquitin-protein ligase LIN-1 n=1 Tax=Ilex paraguariensis TaxID=185542 RepID=A0ABC8R1W1_9AQUA